MSLELLFKIVIDYGEYVRKNNFDGLIYWNKIKSFLSKDAIFNKDKIEINWNIKLKLLNGSILSNIEEIYDYFYCELGMKGEETDENDESNSYWENYHFVLQLVRIPKNNKLSLLRLCQIAYNIGQFTADYYKSCYTDKVKKIYFINNMRNIRAYVNIDLLEDNNYFIENIAILSNITSELNKKSDKNLHHKYKKYKSKYMKLKI